MINHMILQVSSNGVLSFNRSFTSPSAGAFPTTDADGDVLIAPFWTDIDLNVAGGRVYYRFSTDPSLLSEIGFNISTIFETAFAANLLFIATWDRVAEFGSNGTLVSSCLSIPENFRNV